MGNEPSSPVRSRFSGFGKQAPGKNKIEGEVVSADAMSVANGGDDVSSALAAGDVKVITLPLDAVLESPHQPRQRAITKRDVEDLMPIIVTAGKGEHEGKYVVHAGHRRCAALRFLGQATVRAIVRDDLDDRTARRLALADNLGREDLTAYEEALALKKYCEDFKVDLESAGRELGLKRTHLHRLEIIGSASEAMSQVFKEAKLSARAAELVAKLEKREPKKAMRVVASFIDGQVTLNDLEEALRAAKTRGHRESAAPDVEFHADKRGVRLRVSLPALGRTEAQLARTRNALAECMGHLGIDSLQAAVTQGNLAAEEE